jgi:hypothetical protein
LGHEVPRWQRDNQCYSCHNNGDGARALLEARKQGFPLPPECLDDTRRWLEQPLEWDRFHGEGGFNDKTLSHIQFARALASALPPAGGWRDTIAAEAARIVAKDQKPAGYWRIDDGGAGTPCTYGNALATAQACQALKSLAPVQYADALRRAEQWLTSQPRNSLVDQVAVIFGLEQGHDDLCHAAGAAILASQNADGGWGPYATSGSEPFDTAVAVLALSAGKSARRRRLDRDHAPTRRRELRAASVDYWLGDAGVAGYAKSASVSMTQCLMHSKKN